mgnify:CR=1 FL=1
MDISEKAKLLLKCMDDKTECEVICEIFPTCITSNFQNGFGHSPLGTCSISMDMMVNDPTNLNKLIAQPNEKRHYLLVEVKDE